MVGAMGRGIALGLAMVLGVFLPALAAVDGRVDVAGDPFQSGSWSGKAAKAIEHYYAGRLEEAADALIALHAEEGVDEFWLRSQLAVVYKDLDRLELAEREVERLTALAPDDGATLLNWSFLALQRGEYEEALRRFVATLALGDDPWALLGVGMSLERLGRSDEAVLWLEKAVAAERRLALGHALLGSIHLESQRYDEAASALAAALRLDPSYLPVYHQLARAYEGAGKIDEAWDYYDRARRVLPSDPQVQADFERFLALHYDRALALERAKEERKTKPSHVVAASVSQEEATIPIKVGIAEGLKELAFSAGSDFVVRPSSGDPIPLEAGLWVLALKDGTLTLQGGPQAREFSLDPVDLRFELARSDATWIVYDLEAGSGYFWARLEDRQVRGDLLALARGHGFTLVNELDLEAYLLSVVPSEMYASMPMEALKAQAIAARTYALNSLGRYQSRGFDVFGGVASAAYRGVDWEHPRTTEAVLATRGQVLTHRGRLAEALYHASAGGHTASSADAWGGSFVEYLQAVPEWADSPEAPVFPLAPKALENWIKHIPDTYSARADAAVLGTYRWAQPVSADELTARVNRIAPIGEVLRVIPLERGAGGHVRSVEVAGTEGSVVLTGDRIRSALGGLKSNAFKAESFHRPDGSVDFFLFFGAGFGHGVGMSQMGAAGMAKEGHSAEAILMHYYRGADIASDYNRGDR